MAEEKKEEAKKAVEEKKETKEPEKKGGEEMAEEKKEGQESPKSRLYALLICLFFGWAGGHRYYVKKIGTGLALLFTAGGFGMWWFIDVIMISIGAFKDKDNLSLKKWT